LGKQEPDGWQGSARGEKTESRLARVNGQRLRSVILYGSEACGQTRPDSDVDVLVLLDDPVDYGRDLGKNLAALYPLALAAS